MHSSDIHKKTNKLQQKTKRIKRFNVRLVFHSTLAKHSFASRTNSE